MPTYAAQPPARVQTMTWNRVYATPPPRQGGNMLYQANFQGLRTLTPYSAQNRVYLAAALAAAKSTGGSAARPSSGLLFPARPRR